MNLGVQLSKTIVKVSKSAESLKENDGLEDIDPSFRRGSGALRLDSSGWSHKGINGVSGAVEYGVDVQDIA